MHEHGVVEELIERLLPALRERGVERVRQVRVRRHSTFAEAPLRQAFELLSRGTPLEGAELRVEEVAVDATCTGCGRAHRIGADDLVGHLYECPDCGAVQVVEEAHGLELAGVTAAEPGGGGSG